MADRRLYKVIFYNQGKVFEVYARSVSQDAGQLEAVVAAQEPGRVIGMLSRKNLIAAYHDRVTELQSDGENAAESDGAAFGAT